jgi:hypothetical protein
LEKLFGKLEGFPVLAAQRIRLVQYRRDSPLFAEGWERDFDSRYDSFRDLFKGGSCFQAPKERTVCPQPVIEKSCIETSRVRHEALEALIGRDG